MAFIESGDPALLATLREAIRLAYKIRGRLDDSGAVLMVNRFAEGLSN